MDGITLIAQRVKNAPTTPGVYRMLAEDGKVLYVGKAKNLKNRLIQYTQPERMGARIRKMVFETRDLVIVETRTEAEALLLEANLIKSLKPHYNIIFRDDASYVSVVITHDETPLIRSHRGPKKTGGDYFGPYPSAGAVYQTLDLMERAFRLRTCPDSTFRNRSRPCLKYDIKRCSGPCTGKISRSDYAASVAQAKAFLKGDRTGVLKTLQETMQTHATNLNYEKAAAVRDSIQAIAAVMTASTATTHALTDADVFAWVEEAGRRAIQAFYYRGGQHIGNHTFYPKTAATAEDSPAEAFTQFLAQHYTTRQPPLYIYTNIPPEAPTTLEEALSTSAGRRIHIETPKRGEKLAVVEQATHNARAALSRKSLETDGWRTQMQAFFNLLSPLSPASFLGARATQADETTSAVARGREEPMQSVTKPISNIESLSIECYDISNISGRFPVASQVVAGPEGMAKSRYRRYTIRSKNTPDDYAMMREVLTRRVARLKPLLENAEETDPTETSPIPGALLVDGGKGQLNVLIEVIQQAGLWGHPNCPALCGIAKGEERDKGLETIFHATPGGITELPIPFNSPLKFLLQRIRDEAHRFAITFHRETRSKAITQSKLDSIPGIGAKKKKALLLHFGSVAGVEGADISSLMQVEGINATLAQTIYDFFHS